MGIFLDLFVIAIIILSVFLGYKKGLVNVIFNVFAFLIAIVITFILYKPATSFVINNTELDEKIENVIIEKGVSGDEQDEEQEKSILDEYIDKYITDTKDEAIESVAGVIAQKVIEITVGIFLFIIVRILLILAKVLVNGVSELPFVKQFNELGGALYGIIRGMLIVYIILAVLFFVVSLNNRGNIADAIDSSILTKVLYANNIILKILF